MEHVGNHQRKLTLADFFEWIGEGTTGDSAAEAYTRSERLHHRAIEAVGDGLDAHVLRVRGLHLILFEWLHLDDMPRVHHARVVVLTGVVLCDYSSSKQTCEDWERTRSRRA